LLGSEHTTGLTPVHILNAAGGEGIHTSEYTGFGRVTEFKYSAEIGNAFRGNNPIKYLNNFGKSSVICNVKVKLPVYLVN
jgi:hypothetical protein